MEGQSEATRVDNRRKDSHVTHLVCHAAVVQCDSEAAQPRDPASAPDSPGPPPPEVGRLGAPFLCCLFFSVVFSLFFSFLCFFCLFSVS